MKLKHYKKDALEYIVIDNLYNASELVAIKKELNELIPHLKSVEVIQSATNKDNEYSKDCLSLWLYKFYGQYREKSIILNLSKKIFSKEVTSFSANANAFFRHIEKSTTDSILLNVYKSGEKYLPHIDDAMISIITLFELGKVKNGGISFPDYDEHIEFKDNRAVIFPGCVSHATGNILTEKNSYRVSIAQFLNYKII